MDATKNKPGSLKAMKGEGEGEERERGEGRGERSRPAVCTGWVRVRSWGLVGWSLHTENNRQREREREREKSTCHSFL